MVETALSTATFAVLVVIFFCLLMCAVTLALSGVALLVGFVVHLVDNHKARKHVQGR